MSSKKKRQQAAAKNAAFNSGSHFAVIVGIVIAIMLFTYSGGGASLRRWVSTEGVVADAYTTEATESKAETYHAVIRYTDGEGETHEAAALLLETPLDDQIGQTVEIEYKASGSVRVVGNCSEQDDTTTTRNLIIGIVAVIGVYFLSEIVKYFIPPEMVYEKIQGLKKKKD